MMRAKTGAPAKTGALAGLVTPQRSGFPGSTMVGLDPAVR